MGFFDKVKSSVNDISNSVSGAIDDQKTNMKVREEQKKIDQANAEVGKIIADCMSSGKEFDDSMIADQMRRIIEAKRTIAELKGESFYTDYEPGAGNSHSEPAQTVVSIAIPKEDPPAEPKPIIEEEPVTEEPIVKEPVQEEIVEEELPEAEPVVEEPVEDDAIENKNATLAPVSVPNRMSGRFRTFMEASITASSHCSKWKYNDGSSDIYDTDSLVGMAEIHDAENQLDDDTFYIVLEDGSIGVKKDCEAVDWAFIPAETGNEMRESFDAAIKANGPSLVGFSSKINDPEILGSAEGPGEIWYGKVIDRNTDIEFTEAGEEIGIYRTIIRKSDGTLHTIEERGDSPMFLWLSKGDRVRYVPVLDTFEKYDKSVDVAMPCLVCGCMNDIHNDRCYECGKPLLK